MIESASASTPVTRALDELHIPYRLFQHPGPVHSLEQAAAERGQRPQQVVRSIVFRLAQDVFAMVLIAGPAQISWPALRTHLGQSRLTTATEIELLAVTGYPPGAVAPFGLPAPMRILVDRSVLAEEELSLGSGRRYLAVVMRTEDLLRGLGAVEVGDFAAARL
jgi:prolyl-tRNA editing enzyme YbaK/EbsC (Cys-tRNA(Pro) deacylase)